MLDSDRPSAAATEMRAALKQAIVAANKRTAIATHHRSDPVEKHVDFVPEPTEILQDSPPKPVNPEFAHMMDPEFAEDLAIQDRLAALGVADDDSVGSGYRATVESVYD